MVQPLRKVADIHQKIKNGITTSSSIGTLGIYTKESKPGSHRGVSTPIYNAALSTAAKKWQQPKNVH